MIAQITAISAIILPVFLIVLSGYIYAKFELPNMQVINKMILQLFVPALVFSVMSSKDFEIAIYSKLALVAMIVVIITGVISYGIAKLFHYNWKTFIPPMMFKNWGNLGIPLIVFSFGNEALNAAVILFLAGNVVHFTIGIILMSGRFNVVEFLKTPVIVAMFLGLFANLIEWQVPVFLFRPIEMLGQAAIPLMLVSLGVRLKHVFWNDLPMALTASIIGPVIGLITAYFCATAIGLDAIQTKQVLIFGALPPAVVNYMFAEKYDLEPDKVASIVLVSNMMSIAVYFLLLYFII